MDTEQTSGKTSDALLLSCLPPVVVPAGWVMVAIGASQGLGGQMWVVWGGMFGIVGTACALPAIVAASTASRLPDADRRRAAILFALFGNAAVVVAAGVLLAITVT